MSLDYGFVVCAKCGKGYDFEQLAQNAMHQWQQVDLWSLPNGRDLQPYLRRMWSPLCPECGGDKFYPMINTDEIVEYLEQSLQDGSLIDEAERKLTEALLTLWKDRMQAEDAEWRSNAKQAREQTDCDCDHH
jgi:hypothetical protein